MDDKTRNVLYALTIAALAITLFLGPVAFSLISFQTGDYSPLPAVADKWVNPEREPVLIYGLIIFEENYTAVQELEVRLFAADELKTEYVLTDESGYFYSSLLYNTEAGLSILGTYSEHRSPKRMRDRLYVAGRKPS